MAELSDLACFTFIPNPIYLLPEKSLKKVKTYADTSEDERNAKPDFSGDSQLPFSLQVVAEGDTKEDAPPVPQIHFPKMEGSAWVFSVSDLDSGVVDPLLL